VKLSWHFLHLALAAASIVVFCLRAPAALVGAQWPLQPAVRLLGMLIDIALVATGAWLAWRLHSLPMWLLVKLLLVLGYAVLAALSLQRKLGWWGRLAGLLGAGACLVLLLGVVRAHHPLGWWA
jgi:uncharacterized membrane protein SirB2